MPPQILYHERSSDGWRTTYESSMVRRSSADDFSGADGGLPVHSVHREVEKQGIWIAIVDP